MYAKRVCKDCEIKDLDGYHDLCLKSDVLLLADLFENFREMFLNISDIDPVKLISAPGLAWEAARNIT